MNIEKPISTIRRAIEGVAEEKAYKSSEKIEQKHFDESIKFYKKMRDTRPDEVEKLILLSVEGKELRDKIGMELYIIFDPIWKNVTKGFLNKLIKRACEIKGERELTDKEFIKEIDTYAETLLRYDSKILKEDPRIISAFLGKEELLNKIIDYAVSTTIYIARNF